MAVVDVSDDIVLHHDDVDTERFQIAWACRGELRPGRRPVDVDYTLSGNRRHLVVTLNDIVYCDEDLPGEASRVEHQLQSSKEADKVYVIVHKMVRGWWIRER